MPYVRNAAALLIPLLENHRLLINIFKVQRSLAVKKRGSPPNFLDHRALLPTEHLCTF